MNKQKTKWSNEDEATLLELVENYERKGKSKQEAFMVVANIINRTKSACASRYRLLKTQKTNKSTNTSETKNQLNNSLNLEQVIVYLKKYEYDQLLSEQNVQLHHTILKLKEENEKMSKKMLRLKMSIEKNHNLLKNLVN